MLYARAKTGGVRIKRRGDETDLVFRHGKPYGNTGCRVEAHADRLSPDYCSPIAYTVVATRNVTYFS